MEKKEIVEREKKRLQKKMLSPEDINEYLIENQGARQCETKISMIELMKRPQVNYEDLKAFADPASPASFRITPDDSVGSPDQI